MVDPTEDVNETHKSIGGVCKGGRVSPDEADFLVEYYQEDTVYDMFEDEEEEAFAFLSHHDKVRMRKQETNQKKRVKRDAE
jgi:hypothetical protein